MIPSYGDCGRSGAQNGWADSDLRFPRDKLLDGRDTIPSYVIRWPLGAVERGKWCTLGDRAGQALGWTGYDPVLRNAVAALRRERGSG